VTAEELVERAATCRSCGKLHAYRWISPYRASWARDDCELYRPFIEIDDIAKLWYLVTGIYADPWLPDGQRPGGSVTAAS
jgi:hypothetical protein